MSASTMRMLGIGLQGGTGTAVVPDLLMHATCELKPKVTKIHPQEDVSSYAPVRHYVGAVEAEGTLKMDATYEELTYILAMAMPYDEPSGTYLWEWPLPFQTAPATYLFTVEFQDEGPYDSSGAYTIRLTDTIGTYAPPDDLADWGDYVHAVVSRYRGRVRYYQLWNEPKI